MPKKTKRKTTTRTTVIKQSDKPSDELITFVLIADSPIYRMKSYGPASLMLLTHTNQLGNNKNARDDNG